MEFFSKVFLTIAVFALMAILISVPVMLLWNWLMPTIFGLVTITFWQALGLSFLCNLLFKGSAGSSS